MYPEIGLFIVADGMGGAEGGEIAAQMAVELVCEAFIGAERSSATGTALPLLIDAIQHANHSIHRAGVRSAARKGMGTTIAALLACGHRAALAHVGDSRVYRLRDGCLTQITEDHSLFNELVRLGRADPTRPEAFTFHNVITRALGPEAHVEVDARLLDAGHGDTFLLCSDGLSGVLRRDEIERILVDHADTDEAAEQLISAANHRGGPDNITVVLVRWEAATAARARA